MLVGSTARIRLINRRHVIGGTWLNDTMLSYAERCLAEYQEEEPEEKWKLQVCGENMDWHNLNIS